MTAKFDAFVAALGALCVEHGVRLQGGDDYDHWGVSLMLATDEAPAGLALDIEDDVLPTREERKAKEALFRQRMAVAAAERAMEEKRQTEFMKSPAYLAMVQQIGEQAAQERKQYMRVSTDPTDPAYIDARPRKAWCNDVLIEGWTVADEFRRCVITPEKVHNGAVLIERLPDEGPAVAVAAEAGTAPIHAGFSGMFVSTPDKPAEQNPAATPVSTDAKPAAVSFAIGATTPAPKVKVKTKAKHSRR